MEWEDLHRASAFFQNLIYFFMNVYKQSPLSNNTVTTNKYVNIPTCFSQYYLIILSENMASTSYICVNKYVPCFQI